MNNESTARLAVQPRDLERLGAKTALACTAAYIILIICLHVIRADLSPSWHLLSEYALGSGGWLMAFAFIFMGTSYAALFLAIVPLGRNLSGIIGLALLAAVAIASLAAAFLPMDALGTPPEQMSNSGHLHALMGMIAIPGLPVAALLLTSALAWRGRYLENDSRPLWLSAHFTWLCFGAMIAYLVLVLPHAGGFGPTVAVGAFNRLVVVADAIWTAQVAWAILRRTK